MVVRMYKGKISMSTRGMGPRQGSSELGMQSVKLTRITRLVIIVTCLTCIPSVGLGP